MTRFSQKEQGDQSRMEAAKLDWGNITSFFFIYFFEYAIITGMIDRISDLKKEENPNSSDYFVKNFYTIGQFLY